MSASHAQKRKNLVGSMEITVPPSQTATSTDASTTVPVDVTVPFKHAKQDVLSEFEKRSIARPANPGRD